MLFERLLALDPAAIDPESLAARRATAGPANIDALIARHDALRPEIVAEIRRQLETKQLLGDALVAELTLIRERWGDIVRRIGAVMLPVATIEKALREAGCPDRPSAIGCDRDRAIHTLRVCRHMRDRYVALDLIDDLGLLDDWATAAVDRAEAPDDDAPTTHSPQAR
jgi:hypothetical protein